MRQFPPYRSFVTTTHPICHATSGKQVPRSVIDVIGVNSGLEGCCPSGAVARSSPGVPPRLHLVLLPGPPRERRKRKSASTGKGKAWLRDALSRMARRRGRGPRAATERCTTGGGRGAGVGAGCPGSRRGARVQARGRSKAAPPLRRRSGRGVAPWPGPDRPERLRQCSWLKASRSGSKVLRHLGRRDTEAPPGSRLHRAARADRLRSEYR